MDVGWKGGEMRTSWVLFLLVEELLLLFLLFSSGGEGANDGMRVSWVRIWERECRLSQGGGRMLARPWDFRRMASQRGISAGMGGRRGGVVP